MASAATWATHATATSDVAAIHRQRLTSAPSSRVAGTPAASVSRFWTSATAL